MKSEEIKTGVAHEPTIEFKSISDRTAYIIQNQDTSKNLVEISGYDLNIAFNMEYINSIEDVELAITGLSDLFRGIIMDNLLKNKQQP